MTLPRRSPELKAPGVRRRAGPGETPSRGGGPAAAEGGGGGSGGHARWAAPALPTPAPGLPPRAERGTEREAGRQGGLWGCQRCSSAHGSALPGVSALSDLRPCGSGGEGRERPSSAVAKMGAGAAQEEGWSVWLKRRPREDSHTHPPREPWGTLCSG